MGQRNVAELGHKCPYVHQAGLGLSRKSRFSIGRSNILGTICFRLNCYLSLRCEPLQSFLRGERLRVLRRPSSDLSGKTIQEGPPTSLEVLPRRICRYRSSPTTHLCSPSDAIRISGSGAFLRNTESFLSFRMDQKIGKFEQLKAGNEEHCPVTANRGVITHLTVANEKYFYLSI